MASKYRKKTKYSKKYRITNWPEYNRSLVQRGNFTFLISPDAINSWKHVASKPKRGGQRKYSDQAIELALSLRVLFKMSLRQTEGFMMSLVALSKINMEVPNYSTLSRRAASLPIKSTSTRKYKKNERITLIVDSTGLKVFGEREWQQEKHKTKVRRTWRKLHLAIDGEGLVIAHKLTTNKEGDAPVALELVDQVENEICGFLGDGAYDSQHPREKLAEHNQGAPPNVIIPPRKQAVKSKKGNTQRDQHIQYIEQHGRRKWEKESNYGLRNRVENTMYRYKTLIGRSMKSRSTDNQSTEASIGVNLLNWMTDLGMPKTVVVS